MLYILILWLHHREMKGGINWLEHKQVLEVTEGKESVVFTPQVSLPVITSKVGENCFYNFTCVYKSSISF